MPDLIFSLAKILVVGLFTTQTGIAYRQNETGTAPTEASAWARQNRKRRRSHRHPDCRRRIRAGQCLGAVRPGYRLPLLRERPIAG
ncbi:MAG: hypothetical protein ACKVKH_08420 [Verrucomicrobiales bacterium]